MVFVLLILLTQVSAFKLKRAVFNHGIYRPAEASTSETRFFLKVEALAGLQNNDGVSAET